MPYTPEPTTYGEMLQLPGCAHMFEVRHYSAERGFENTPYPFTVHTVEDRFTEYARENRTQTGHVTNEHAQALADFLAASGFVPAGFVPEVSASSVNITKES